MTTPVIIKTNPCGPVQFSYNAVQKACDAAYLIADTKEDGVQLNLCVGRVYTDWLSRTGKAFPALHNALQAGFGKVLPHDTLVQLPTDVEVSDAHRWVGFVHNSPFPNGLMLQAEMIVKGETAAQTAGTLRRNAGVDPKRLEVHIFGVIPIGVVKSGEDYNVSNALMKYHVEFTVGLLKLYFPEIDFRVAEYQEVYSMGELQRLYEHRRDQGKEGLVVKDPHAIWKRGKKVGQWKMKPEATIDGNVRGLIWGTPGLANEGKVIGFKVLLENGVEVDVTGLTQGNMLEFTAEVLKHNDWDADDVQHTAYGPLALVDDENPYHDWAVQIGYMEMTEAGSLRHPFFDVWRGMATNPTEKV